MRLPRHHVLRGFGNSAPDRSRRVLDASALTRPRLLPRSRRLLGAFSDERLAGEAKRGNDLAFEVIYDRHHRGILSFCRHMLRSQEDAEDAVQQTFGSAFRSLGDMDNPARLKAWLYTIARNRCLNMLRARREEPVEEVEAQSPVAGPSEEVERRAELRDLLSSLERLPERQRAALVLAEVGALAHSEVAQVLDCGTDQVKALVFQARSALIEDRRAREIPCVEVREQLATATAGQLRRAPLRRHLRQCEGCAQFREEVRDQRRLLALALPVAPSLGLKESALAAAGIGGGGAAGGGGGLLAALGTSGAVKVATITVAAGGTVGGLAATQPGLVDKAQAAVDRAADEVMGVVSGPSAGDRGQEAREEKASGLSHPTTISSPPGEKADRTEKAARGPGSRAERSPRTRSNESRGGGQSPEQDVAKLRSGGRDENGGRAKSRGRDERSEPRRGKPGGPSRRGGGTGAERDRPNRRRAGRDADGGLLPLRGGGVPPVDRMLKPRDLLDRVKGRG